MKTAKNNTLQFIIAFIVLWAATFGSFYFVINGQAIASLLMISIFYMSINQLIELSKN